MWRKRLIAACRFSTESLRRIVSTGIYNKILHSSRNCVEWILNGDLRRQRAEFRVTVRDSCGITRTETGWNHSTTTDKFQEINLREQTQLRKIISRSIPSAICTFAQGFIG